MGFNTYPFSIDCQPKMFSLEDELRSAAPGAILGAVIGKVKANKELSEKRIKAKTEATEGIINKIKNATHKNRLKEIDDKVVKDYLRSGKAIRKVVGGAGVGGAASWALDNFIRNKINNGEI